MPVLTKGVAAVIPALALNASAHYTIEVPEAASHLRVTITGGAGDIDMFTRIGAQADYDNGDYQFASEEPANDEVFYLQNPRAGVYHVQAYAYEADSTATILADYDESPSAEAALAWEAAALPANTAPWVDMAYGNEVFCTIGGDKAATSVNGRDWVEHALPTTGVNWGALAWTGRWFVAVAYDSQHRGYSVDGESWTIDDGVMQPSFVRPVALRWNGIILLAVGRDSSDGSATRGTYSANEGLAFFLSATLPAAIEATSLTSVGHVFAVTGIDDSIDSRFFYTEETIAEVVAPAWQEASNFPAVSVVPTLAGRGNRVAIVWSNTAQFSSTDNWESAPNAAFIETAVNDADDGSVFCIAALGNLMVAPHSGAAACRITTDGGLVWEQAALPTSADWRLAAAGNGTLVLADSDGTLLVGTLAAAPPGPFWTGLVGCEES